MRRCLGHEEGRWDDGCWGDDGPQKTWRTCVSAGVQLLQISLGMNNSSPSVQMSKNEVLEYCS